MIINKALNINSEEVKNDSKNNDSEDADGNIKSIQPSNFRIV